MESSQSSTKSLGEAHWPQSLPFFLQLLTLSPGLEPKCQVPRTSGSLDVQVSIRRWGGGLFYSKMGNKDLMFSPVSWK